jgi:hypothetical protein
MLISGHEEVLEDIVAGVPDDFWRSGWPSGLSKSELLKHIRRGLAYSDLPCGKLGVVEEGRVQVTSPRLCSLSKMYQLFLPARYGHTQLYQSHLGSRAYMHAMTSDPSHTVGQVARSVAEHILGFSLMAHETATAGSSFYPMWIGVVLHTIMDSYTEAHAIRHEDRATQEANITNDDGAETEVAAAEVGLSKALQTLAERTFEAPLDRRSFSRVSSSDAAQDIQDIQDIQGIQDMSRKSAYQAYLAFCMQAQLARKARALIPGLDEEIDRRLLSDKANAYDIVNFSHYASQSMAAHFNGDRLDLVREHPAMYARMLRECARALGIFRRQLAVHDGGASLLREMLAATAEGPLRIQRERAGQRSGREYAEWSF